MIKLNVFFNGCHISTDVTEDGLNKFMNWYSGKNRSPFSVTDGSKTYYFKKENINFVKTIKEE